jgi:hypothetical protein
MDGCLTYIRIAALTFLSVAVAQAISPDPIMPRVSGGAKEVTLRDGTLWVMGEGAKGDYCIDCYDFAMPYYVKSSIIRLVIEKNVLTIGSLIERGGFDSLMSIEVAGGNAYYSSEDGVLFNKDKTVLIWYPPAKQGAYTIPSSVTEIEEDAFWGSIGLTSVTIPNSVTSIGRWAFRHCSRLTSVTIPNSVTSIGKSAFFECTGLRSVTIPNSVTFIGHSAFSGCISLKSITIPNSITEINGWTFSYCTGLRSVSMPNSITEINEGAFAHCTTLTSVTIPSSVMFIESRAFDGCTGLKSITAQCPIPPLVKSDWAFNDVNTSLIRLIVPKGSGDAYSHNYVWNEFQIVEDTANYSSKNGVVFNKDKTELVRYPMSKKGSYKIPNSVTSIGNYAFAFDSLRSVTIPNSVTSIGRGAFFSCTGLRSVTMPNGVTSIGESAFFGCTGLKSVTLPDGMISTGDLVFGGCTGLKSVTIPNSVTSIGMAAFYGCAGLKSIAIPNSVAEIGDTAFYECTGLKSIAIPNSVTKIGEAAFYGCTGLKSIAIPNSVTEIGELAFDSCDNLASIIVQNPTPPKYILKNVDEHLGLSRKSRRYILRNVDEHRIDLYVPKGSVESYSASKPWGEFKNIKEIPDDFEGTPGIVEDIPDISEGTNGNRGVWIVFGIISALVLSVAVFVVIRRM